MTDKQRMVKTHRAVMVTRHTGTGESAYTHQREACALQNPNVIAVSYSQISLSIPSQECSGIHYISPPQQSGLLLLGYPILLDG